jgi:hypothetical protein
MAQTIDHLSLKNLITTILSSEIGTYTFSNGTTTPAIWVEGVSNTAGEKPLQASGLEVVIVINTESDFTPMLSTDYRLAQTSEVILKQWNETKDTSAARALLFANATFQNLVVGNPIRVLPNASFGTIEQQTIFIRHF